MLKPLPDERSHKCWHRGLEPYKKENEQHFLLAIYI